MTNKTKTLKDNPPKETPQTEKKDESKLKEEKSDPTKYGDWQVNGRAIDF